MDTMIQGQAYVLGNDVDTDQIIPAQHLVYNMEKPEERRLYGVYAFSGVPEAESGLPKGRIPFIHEGAETSEFKIVIAGKNFGCGSSREHAPAAMHIAGVKAVVATSYARIFYRNAVDGGFLIPYESQIDLSKEISTNDMISIETEKNLLKNETTGKTYALNPLGEVAGIVNAGGIFEYAKINDLIEK